LNKKYSEATTAEKSMMPSLSHVGRVAVVTGSNKGIGYFIALQLGMSGLFQYIILACRDLGRADIAAESIRKQLPSTVSVQSEQLMIGDHASHTSFVSKMERTFGKVDCLVNNAGFAFKGNDPTPFCKQTKPTMDINFRGTIDFTESMIPLIKKGSDPRIVVVASTAGRLSQVSGALQSKFSSNSLTMNDLRDLVNDFESKVQTETHQQAGYSNWNYGMSKLAVIAATKILARKNEGVVAINCCCPGYCRTDMTGLSGTRDPADGARNAVIPATMDSPPNGAFFSDYVVANW
jgi:carbonyl reductase 1